MNRAWQNLLAIFREDPTKKLTEELVLAAMNGEFLVPAEFVTNDIIYKYSRLKVKDSLSIATTNLQRITLFQPCFTDDGFYERVGPTLPILSKNIEIAKRFQKMGEKYSLDLEKNGNEAIRAYTLAISFVPPDDTLFEDLFLERSHIYFRLGDILSFQRDTTIADRRHTGRAGKSFRLLAERNAKMLENRRTQPKTRKEAEEILKMKKYLDSTLFNVFKGPHRKYPVASEHVKLRYNRGTKERRIQAKADLPPGSSIIVENPYVAVFDNDLIWEMKHCFHCFAKLRRTFPCHGCVFAVYCDENCRKADYDGGHRFECPCLKYLHAIRAQPLVRLCLKAICKAGIEQLYDIMIRGEKEEMKEKPCVPGIHPKTQEYNSTKFYPLAFLKGHVVEAELVGHVWLALTLASILESQTSFYECLPEAKQGRGPELFAYVASLLLGTILSFPYNSVGVSIGENEIKEESSEGNLTGVYPYFSMLNHSCDPNAFWTNLPSGKLAVITNREIKKGEEITISYGFDYTFVPLKDRIHNTKNRYHFDCKCLPCVKAWPVYSDLEVGGHKWICSFCRDLMNFSQEDLIDKCTLNPVSPLEYECRECKSVHKHKGLHPKFKAFNKELAYIDKLVKEEKYLPAIERLKGAICYFQHNICPPNIRSIQSQELLKEAIDNLIAKADRVKF